MNILFTVCGRAGSKGFKNKNLKEMNGVPLVYYTLAAIKGYMDRHTENNVFIALNTDSQGLIDIVRNQKVLRDIIYVPRKEELAGDRVAKVEVIKDTYLTVAKDHAVDEVVDLDITSPLRRVEDVVAAVEELSNHNDYDLVFSVVEARRNPYFNMVEKKQDGYYRKVCEAKYTSRQQAPSVYEMNASIYAYRPSFLESEITKTIIDYNCGIIEMPDYLVLDIDSEEDFIMMQYLHRHFCEQDRKLDFVFKIATKF